ncbi:hypothetical protein [Litoreibacter halocynthiae]|uniref:hypothetical protein n=1 Tax=Litoreibacter halocynthiae TaxID=1242689 RepID=UPI00248FE407|nr:hypothetical protein [Litoreibacter halocynthiae]
MVCRSELGVAGTTAFAVKLMPFGSDPNRDAANRVGGWVATRFLCHYGPLPNGD